MIESKFKMRLGILLLPLLLLVLFSNEMVAATELEKIEITTSYMVYEAEQVKDKTFIVGRELEDSQLSLVVRQGDSVDTLITASELQSDGFDSYVTFIGSDTDNLYLGKKANGSLVVVYIIDKSSHQVSKLTAEKMYTPFIQMLNEAGVDATDLIFDETFFKDGEVLWAVARTPFDPDNENKLGATFVLHKEFGIVKSFENYAVDSYFAGPLQSVAMSETGNLYYTVEQDGKSQLFKYDFTQQKTTSYQSSSDFEVGSISHVDEKNERFYGLITFDGHIYPYTAALEVENGLLAVKKWFYQANGEKLDEDGRFWLYTSEGLAYLDSSFNAKYLYQMDYPVDKFDVYNGTIFYANDFGYGYAVVDELVDAGTDGSGSKKSGWVQDGDTWYYYNDNGKKATGWVESKGDWYYLTSFGTMATGWVQVGKTWYYLEKSGAMATGWTEVGSTWYYLLDSGAMKTGWLESGNKWYYLKASGAMATGWQQIGGVWYFFEKDGAMQTGWLKDGSSWYYLNKSGAMLSSSWLQDGTWYYMTKSGQMAKGWQVINNKWYYFYSNGAMAANTTVGGYRLGSSGAWIQ